MDDRVNKAWTKSTSLYPTDCIASMAVAQADEVQQISSVGLPTNVNYSTPLTSGISRQRPGTFPTTGKHSWSGHSSMERTTDSVSSFYPSSLMPSFEQNQQVVAFPPHPTPTANQMQNSPATGYWPDHGAGPNPRLSSAQFSPMYPSSPPPIGFLWSPTDPLQTSEPAAAHVGLNNQTPHVGHSNQTPAYFNKTFSQSFDIPDRRQSIGYDSRPMLNVGTSPFSPTTAGMSPYNSSTFSASPYASSAVSSSPHTPYSYYGTSPYPSANFNTNPYGGVNPYSQPQVGISPHSQPNVNCGTFPPHPVTVPYPSSYTGLDSNALPTKVNISSPVSPDANMFAVPKFEQQMQTYSEFQNQYIAEQEYLSLGFEDLYGEKRNSVSLNHIESPAYDHIYQSRDTAQSGDSQSYPLTVPEGEQFEPLKVKTSADPDSESFLAMVVDLKEKYVSTDESTNPGFLLNQIKEYHTTPQSIKVTLHSKFLNEPFICSCSTEDKVEHIILQTLRVVSSPVKKSHPVDFILKVYNQTEYLSNDLQLAQFEYIHSCLKLGTDISLELLLRDEIPRPFLRTISDDSRVLRFPKDNSKSNSGTISFDGLTKILYSFYQKADFLLKNDIHFTDGEKCIQDLEMSVTEICAKLAGIETVQITEALTRLRAFRTNLKGSSINCQASGYGGSLKAEGAIVSPQDDIVLSIKALIKAVKDLVCLYCCAFSTDFSLASAIETKQDYQDVTEIQEEITVRVASIHCIPVVWRSSFEKYKLACSLYHGSRKLSADVTSNFQPMTSNIHRGAIWNEELRFGNILLSQLPFETRICFVLYGQRVFQEGMKTTTVAETVPLCAGAIQLFNEKGFLLQGSQLVSLTTGNSVDKPSLITSCKSPSTDSLMLLLNLKNFENNIIYPELKTIQVEAKAFSTLNPDTQMRINDIIEKNSSCSEGDYNCLWKHRQYLMERPSLYLHILRAVPSWDSANVAEVYCLLDRWNDIHPFQALELLLPDFPDTRVRWFATEKLRQMSPDALACFLPQLIQALKFESHHNSHLAKLVLEQSCKSPRFAHQFFWLLRGIASQEVSFQYRYKMLFLALVNISGEALCQELKKQEELVTLMTTVTESVKSATDKDSTLSEELTALIEMLNRSEQMFLPHNLGMEVVGLNVKSCSYFSSNAVPMKFVFMNANPAADPHYLIYKIGDDLRQDMLTMQIIDIMDSLWLKHDLDLKMVKFTCLTTGPEKGIIDMVRKSETLHKIQAKFGVMGSFKEEPILAWLQEHNPLLADYRKAIENFTLSCAGYCVATYILGICDRHNDNIMIKETGHMFHIDFGKFLGDSQMFGNFKRDRVPFVFTSDMAYVITSGGKQAERYQYFVDLCCQAFNILRQHADLLKSLFLLMSRSGIHMVTENAAKYVQDTLLLGLTNAEATAKFTRMIEDSLRSFFTKMNFLVHNLAHMEKPSSQHEILLSFVPKVFSKETDGKIESVEFFNYEKRYTPEKHYIYIFMVRRENQNQHRFVFRHFLEILEFRDKLSLKFSTLLWPDFSSRFIMVRSNVHTVAESRKSETENFLKFLWACEKDVSESELVYTFFHPLLRDDEEEDKSRSQSAQWAETSREPQSDISSSGIPGQIKLSIQYKKGALQIMVMHVKDLAEEHILPSAYVKTRLLPDVNNVTKRKTNTVRRTCHPTFNELLQYRMPLDEIKHRILLVTVWNEELLKRRCLGAVYIRPCMLDLNQDNTSWHKLGQLQLGD